MAKFTIEVIMQNSEFYQVEAESAKEAEALWSAGEAGDPVHTTDGETYDTHVNEGWRYDDE